MAAKNAGDAEVTFVMRSERAGNQGFVEEVRQAVWSVNCEFAGGVGADDAGRCTTNRWRGLRSRW